MARIAFVLRDPTYFRFVEGMICRLAQRGHPLAVICQEPVNAEAAGGAANLPLVVDRRLTAKWLDLARMLGSYAHWLSGDYQWSAPLRERWVRLLPVNAQRIIRWVGRERFERLLSRRGVRSALTRLERLVSAPRPVVEQLRAWQADLVVATPAIYPHSTELDYLKAAQALQRRTAVVVASWDNLTSKGIFHIAPDLVLVWNEAQIAEATQIHGLPRSKMAAVGAAVFDGWFMPQQPTEREAFCREAGLDPARPYVLYAVSSSIVGDESAIAARLVQELATIHPKAAVQVLVRPHPKNQAGLDGLKAAGVPVWPPQGAFPATAEQKLGYYNSLYHAVAVVGLSTSVFVEAAILDRPCVSITAEVEARAPFRHYQHLVEAGCCEFVADAPQAAAAVARLRAGHDPTRAARHRFVEQFVRPGGDKPAADTAAEAIEGLCQKMIRSPV